ncbi:MAG: haloacid dehalogenase-like hydrolase, partial [Gammaproteobacteria bacterium]
MKTLNTFRTLTAALVLALGLAAPAAPAAEALPSWNDGAAKARIVAFVQGVTDPRSRSYVAPAERIAVFDNDGTLWSEQPAYFQLLFAVDRVRAMSARRPEWKTTEPFASVLRGDFKALAQGGEKALLQLVMATHAGMTTEAFERTVQDWIASARHPTTGR